MNAQNPLLTAYSLSPFAEYGGGGLHAVAQASGVSYATCYRAVHRLHRTKRESLLRIARTLGVRESLLTD